MEVTTHGRFCNILWDDRFNCARCLRGSFIADRAIECAAESAVSWRSISRRKNSTAEFNSRTDVPSNQVSLTKCKSCANASSHARMHQVGRAPARAAARRVPAVTRGRFLHDRLRPLRPKNGRSNVGRGNMELIGAAPNANSVGVVRARQAHHYGEFSATKAERTSERTPHCMQAPERTVHGGLAGEFGLPLVEGLARQDPRPINSPLA